MRRRKFRWAVAGLALLAGIATFALWPQSDRFSREKYEHIRVGMSLAEVEAILGPPGDYTTGPARMPSGMVIDFPELEAFLARSPTGPFAIDAKSWIDDHGTIELVFGNDGRVRTMEFGPHTREPLGPVDAFLWRAKRQWRRWFPKR
jgi:hypothetical protein